MKELIRIEPGGDAETRLWRTTAEVARLFADWPWVLVGGLMVAILEREHGIRVSRTTVDVDVLIDVRAVTQATRHAADRLKNAGFVPQQSIDGLAQRFVRGDDIVDVLAPEHLGPRADLVTVPPGRTLEAVGGRQALERRRIVTVDAAGQRFALPVPTLLGAVVIKARVSASSRQEKHLRDLARLLALVDDLAAMHAEMSRSERKYLRARSELRDPGHAAWSGIANSEDAIIALERLSEPDRIGS
jgi:hypothetical protein